MVAGLLVNGCWVVSQRLLGCSSMVAGLFIQWLLGCYLVVAGFGLLVNGCWVVSKWLLGR